MKSLKLGRNKDEEVISDNNKSDQMDNFNRMEKGQQGHFYDFEKLLLIVISNKQSKNEAEVFLGSFRISFLLE